MTGMATSDRRPACSGKRKPGGKRRPGGKKGGY